MNKSKVKKELAGDKSGIDGTERKKGINVETKEMVKPNEKLKRKLIPHCYNIYRPQNGENPDEED